MEILNEYLTRLVELIGGVKDEKEMITRLIIGLVIFFVVLIFKSQIANVIISLINRLLFKNSTNAKSAIKTSLKRPLAYLCMITAFYGSVCIIIPTGANSNVLVTFVKLVMIVLVGWFGINIINNDYSFVLSGDDSASKKTAVKFASNILKLLIALIAGLLVLEQFGISATKIFAALGIGGVAVAFACKDAVENMLSGFIIIYDKPFKVDDYIEINGEAGTVEDITIRTTRIRSNDGSQKIFPNTTMANAQITNWSNINNRLIDESLSISYSHSSDQIESFVNGIKELIKNHEHVIDDNVRVYFNEFNDSSIDIRLNFKVDTVNVTDYFNLKGQINLELKAFAEQNGMELAFPTRTIYIANE